jgi:hypothetical protein
MRYPAVIYLLSSHLLQFVVTGYFFDAHETNAEQKVLAVESVDFLTLWNTCSCTFSLRIAWYWARVIFGADIGADDVIHRAESIIAPCMSPFLSLLRFPSPSPYTTSLGCRRSTKLGLVSMERKYVNTQAPNFKFDTLTNTTSTFYVDLEDHLQWNDRSTLISFVRFMASSHETAV